MTTATWSAPPIWSVPREWVGERCFVICGGESIRAQRHLIPRLPGRIIAVKHGVILRPDADVAFFAGERAEEIAPPLIKAFRDGEKTLTEYFPRWIVVRGKGHPVFPDDAKRVWRTTDHTRWSDDPSCVAGYDAGTSAINLAMLFGATEVIVLGYDMQGGRWFNGEITHYLPQPHDSIMRKHMEPLPLLAADAKRKGVRIVNCSPISRVTCFEQQQLEMFL